MSKEECAFSLLQMYDDDDDEMEDADREEEESKDREPDPQRGEDEDSNPNDDVLQNVVPPPVVTPTRLLSANTTPSWTNLRPPTPQKPQSSVPKPTIVDYGHDDVAMSPEPEEGEILGVTAGRAMFGEEHRSANDMQERTPTGNVQTMTPNNQVDSQQLFAPTGVSQDDMVNGTTNVSDAEVMEGVNISDENAKDVDPLDKFLPPPPVEKCPDELQEKINKFLAYKRQGKVFNVEVRNRKDYRNPDFLRHAVRYQGIDEIGSNFSKDVYEESDYYDAVVAQRRFELSTFGLFPTIFTNRDNPSGLFPGLTLNCSTGLSNYIHHSPRTSYRNYCEADMKREMERREQERKKSQKVEFVSGGAHTAIAAAAQKVRLPSPSVPNLPSGGLQSGSTDASTREGRQNKKSKWDKVDGDRRNILTGGQDATSAVGAHAALVSAANAGAGYANFAQQKRREAEERKSSDKKAERRS